MSAHAPKRAETEGQTRVLALGVQRFDLKFSHGTLPHDRLMTCIELYGTRVIPRVRELLQ